MGSFNKGEHLERVVEEVFAVRHFKMVTKILYNRQNIKVIQQICVHLLPNRFYTGPVMQFRLCLPKSFLTEPMTYLPLS
jgi:hypothetical protein